MKTAFQLRKEASVVLSSFDSKVVAKALNNLTVGATWTGVGKGALFDCWAREQVALRPEFHASFKAVTLPQWRDECLAVITKKRAARSGVQA